jgi:transposase
MVKRTQVPICKELIKKSNYYLPIFKNEKEFKRINMNTWAEFMYYTYYKIKVNKNTCSIDIGCKNFISLYSLNGTCFKIKSDYKIIDNILRDNTLSYDYKDSLINDLIKELHIKSAKFICNNYDVIYIGFVNNKGNINSREMENIEDNLLKILCHTDFLDILKKYSKKYKKELKIVDESFTSKHCSRCGESNKFERILDPDDSERRKYICKYCGFTTDRDLNASRSILIKNEHL